MAAFVILDGPSTEHVTVQALASRRFEVTLSGPGGHSWNDHGTPNPVHAVADVIASFVSQAEAEPLAQRGNRSYNFAMIEGGAASTPSHPARALKLDIRSEDGMLLNELTGLLMPCVERALEQANRAARHGRLSAKVRDWACGQADSFLPTRRCCGHSSGRWSSWHSIADSLCVHRRQCSFVDGQAGAVDRSRRERRRCAYVERMVSAGRPRQGTPPDPASYRTLARSARIDRSNSGDVSAPEIVIEEAAPARWKADSALALAAFIWGITFVVVKGAIRDMSTMYFLALRFTFGSVCMVLLFAKALRRTSRVQLGRGLLGVDCRRLPLAGLCLSNQWTEIHNCRKLGLFDGFVHCARAAHQRSGVSALAADYRVGWRGHRDGRHGGADAASLEHNFSMNRGDVLTLACAVAYAFHLMIVGYFSQREHFESVALGQVVGVALLAWTALLFEPPKASWNPHLALAIVGTGLFATAFTFALQTYAQQYTTSTRAALIFALEPVFALLTAISFGGEPLTRYSLAGGCLILGGILLVELKSVRLVTA